MGSTPTFRVEPNVIYNCATAVKRLSQLDGVRGVALLLVLFFHYVGMQLHTEPGTLPSYLMKCFMWTYSGVDLFFVLSGFLITGILLDNSTAGNYFKVFYIRRACRILPPYLALIGTYIVGKHFLEADDRFQWLFNDPLPIWSYLTFTQNIVMSAANNAGPHWMDVTWSLAVEEHFYLFLPLLVWLVPRRSLPWIFGIMIVTAPLLRHFIPLSPLNSYVCTPWRADSLISGSLLAWCVREPAIVEHIRAHIRKLYWLLFLLPPLLIAVGWIGLSHNGVFEHSIYAAFYSSLVLLLFVHETSPITKLLSWRPLMWVGTLSYGLYLIHEPVSGLMHGLIRHASPGIFSVPCAVVTLMSLVITFALAAASYYLVERHFISLGHAWKYSKPISSPTAPPPASLRPVPIAVDSVARTVPSTKHAA